MKPITLHRLSQGRALVLAAAAALVLGQGVAQSPPVPTIDFDDDPLLARNNPANVVLALSVETPTSGPAYKDPAYVDGKLYLGYFNSRRCYTYPGLDGVVQASSVFQEASHYFRPVGSTSESYHCNVAGAAAGFSGNYLNYAAMSAPDIMRMALTGGDRGIDEQTRTVLDRGVVAFTHRSTVRAAVAARVTPFGYLNRDIHTLSCGDQIRFTTSMGSVCANADTADLAPVAADRRRQGVKPRVLVCDADEGPSRQILLGSSGTSYNFCTKYVHNGTTGYKPEGQIQKRSGVVRLAAMSYLIETGRHGGVLRAPMKYVGPNAYNVQGVQAVNSQREWLPTTGQFVDKPINDTVSNGYARTGVINYVNRFGKDGGYRDLDPVGELWYEALRYLQGLQPTPNAVNGTISTTAAGGYPVYKTWTDPVTSACQRRNFILGIGDVHTHFDRALPGLTKAQQDALSPAPAGFDFVYGTSNTIPGSQSVLDAHVWTRIIDGFERAGAASVAYTDAKARSQATGGANPAPRVLTGSLDTTPTGAYGVRSSHHWAGLAYWANTQPIRYDAKGGASMDKVRVKTFMIDVDESALSDEAIKDTTFHLAGKYGYFDDVAENGNPFTEPEGSQWLDGTFAKGYVKASQPERLIAGVQRFFEEASQSGSALSAAAVSSNSLAARSPDSRRYNSSFTAGRWTGTVRATALKLHTATNTVTEDPAVLWDANLLLTTASTPNATLTAAHVRPADRSIFTYIRGEAPKAVPFTFAGTGNARDLPASFNMLPYTQDTDNLAQGRINYLRGERSGEASGLFRPRTGILGDILNSGTVYKAGASPNAQGADYTAFFNSQRNRTPVIYVGANDGMLHAFKADSGKELFAYIPGAVLDKLPQLTARNYIHTPFVDAVPVVEEIRLASGWRTALVSGMGGGAQGVFALDVTDPESFGTGQVMFEFTDRDDPQMGNVVGRPSLVKMRTGQASEPFKYFAVVASGYNNYKADGHAAPNNDQVLFFLDLGKSIGTAWSEGLNYFKVVLPARSQTALNGLAQPGVRHGLQGEALEFFAGDLQGQLWKIAFPDGIDRTRAESAVRRKGGGVKTPMFVARDAASLPQPITTSPVVYPSLSVGNMGSFGTGKYLEGADRNVSTPQSIYGIWDSGSTVAANYELVRSKLNPVAFDAASRQFKGNAVAFSLASNAKQGWYADLPFSMERIVNAGTESTGVVSFSSTIPPPTVCSDNGRSEEHFFRPSSGISAASSIAFSEGLLNQSAVLEIELSGEPAYGKRVSSGRRTAVKKDVHMAQGATAKGGASVEQGFRVNYLATGRVYWREVRDFNQVSQ